MWWTSLSDFKLISEWYQSYVEPDLGFLWSRFCFCQSASRRYSCKREPCLHQARVPWKHCFPSVQFWALDSSWISSFKSSFTHGSNIYGTLLCYQLPSHLMLLVFLELLPEPMLDFAPYLHVLLSDHWIFSWVPTLRDWSLQAAESSPAQQPTQFVMKADFLLSSC